MQKARQADVIWQKSSLLYPALESPGLLHAGQREDGGAFGALQAPDSLACLCMCTLLWPQTYLVAETAKIPALSFRSKAHKVVGLGPKSTVPRWARRGVPNSILCLFRHQRRYYYSLIV